MKAYYTVPQLLYLFLFILYLSSDKNMKSKHLEEELKGKSIFVQQKLLLNGSNPLPNKKNINPCE